MLINIIISIRELIMPNQLSRFLLLSTFLSVTISNFAIEISQTESTPPIAKKNYSIGTGISLNYTARNLGFILDSYHLFHSQSRPFDKALIKLGLGVNYDFNPLANQINTGFTLVTSLGYIYIQNQYHQLSLLKQFGAGFTVDYTMINTTSHGVGVTVYLLLNNFLLGFGGGVVIPSNSDLKPYIMSSFGVTF